MKSTLKLIIDFKNLFLLSLLSSFWLCLTITAQQDYFVESITTEQGLSQGTIYDILQDKEGFLWLATKDGLNRYDGQSFKVFTNDVNNPWSISGNFITLLFEDSSGRIWATTKNEGINIYDKNTGRFHHIVHDPKNPNSLSGNFVTSIVEDTSGYFIVAIGEKELNMFRLGPDFFEDQKAPTVSRLDISTISYNKKTTETIIRGLGKDSNGRIWIGSEKGTYSLDVQKLKFSNASKDYIIGTICPDQNGGLWVCGKNNPLAYFDGQKANILAEDVLGAWDMQLDNHNNLWASFPNRVIALSLKNWQKNKLPFQSSKRLIFNWRPPLIDGEFAVKSLYVDRSGIVWIGGNGKGLYKINPNRGLFNLSLAGKSIRKIVPKTNEEFFIFTYNNDWYNEKEDYLINDPLGSKSQILNDNMLISSGGAYYIRQPNLNQIRRINPITQQERIYNISGHHYDTQPMIESRDGKICIAGSNELLVILDPVSSKFIYYDLSTGKQINSDLASDRAYVGLYSSVLYEDSDGVFWFGNGKGIKKFKLPLDETKDLIITNYQNNKGESFSLNYNHVTAMLEDPISPDKYLWVCTRGGGLNKLDKENGNFTHITKENGLPDNVVYGILTDDENNIWGSTNKGLFCMSQLKNTEKSIRYNFRNFSRADGLQDEEFNTGAFAKFPDGRLAFGGINGLNTFDPKEVLAFNYSPKTFITNLLVNNTEILPNDDSGILDQTIQMAKSINLNHLQEIFTLEFASLDFNTPNKNKYRYQLVGAQEEWVDIGIKNSVTFVKLPPNKYIFKLQGSNSQGIWNENITELVINILPPWWKTWWAYLTYLFIALTGVWAYFQFSLNKSKLQQELAFEKREAYRVRDLDYQKSKLYMNMTHEFRTPLTIILGMAQQIEDNPNDNIKEGVNMIVRNGQNLLNLINKMLNLSKLESGKMVLEMEEGDFISFIRTIVDSFRSYAANKEILLHFLPEIDELHISFDKDKIEQVVSNIISNAYKFTPEKGHIYISIKTVNDQAIISIKDTGRGIPAQDIDRIFDRFYQVDNSTTRRYEGTGIGLALSKELVKLMNGTLTAQSPPAGASLGTEFILTLPIVEANNNLEKIGSNQNTPPFYASDGSTIKPKYYEHQGETVEIEKTENIPAESTPLILLVEDNMDVLKYTASCLTSYRLIVAHNGKEGFEQATEFIPDLIISDVMMPIMDGFELCQKIKKDERTNHIPVIILTARADFESKLEGLEIGANAYLPKPFEKKELVLITKNIFDLRNKLKQYYQSIDSSQQNELMDVNSEEAGIIEDDFVVKVREFIQNHISDSTLSVEILAKKMHLSQSQFGRKLDALTGLNPNRLIRNIRLKKAKELLLNKDISINNIAFECGFNDPSYFSRVFKKEFEMTPAEWREKSCQRT